MGSKSKASHPGLYKRGRYWWLTRDPLLGRPQSTRCSSLKAATEYQSERERLGANPAYAASQAAQLGEWCDRFVKMKKTTGTRPATLGYMVGKLGHWIRIHGREAPLSRFVDPLVFDRYLEQRTEEGASNYTVAKECKVFRQVLTSAKRAKVFSADVADLRPEGLDASYVPRDRALTFDEVKALRAELNETLSSIVAIGVSLGLRLSEILGLQPADVDLARRIVTVRGTKTKGSNRVVPIIFTFESLLQEALPFLPLGAKPNNLYRDLNAACARAGMAKAGPNDFRRTHASLLSELGAGEEHTAKLLGHTSTEMVRRVYSKPRAAAIGELVERSIRVAAVARDGQISTGDNEAKSTKTQETASQTPDSSRPPEPKVASSNLARRAGFVVSRRRLSRICSELSGKGPRRPFGAAGRADVASTIALPIGGLVAAAVRMGVIR